MTIIKKIILIISVILFAIPTYAVDMCASDNAIVIVLDPNISHTSGGTSHDVPTSTWRVEFSYGTITDISTCVHQSSSTYSSQVNNGTVFGGEQTGLYCWCKMTHPAVSKWIYIGNRTCPTCSSSAFSSATQCASSCAYACSIYVYNNHNYVRQDLFKSITD